MEVIESIDKTFQNNQIRIVPNPSDGNITLLFDRQVHDLATVMIYDLSGRLVKAFYPSWDNQWEGSLDLGHLDQGIYLVSVQIENINYIKKLILK